MTSTNKLLSETHPKLWGTAAMSVNVRHFEDELACLFRGDVVQSCTVDRAAFDKLVVHCEDTVNELLSLRSDVVRLEKEIAEEQEHSLRQYKHGVAAGDRRALERVKAAIVKLRYVPFVGSSKDAVSDLRVLDELSSELGLDKEEEVQ